MVFTNSTLDLIRRQLTEVYNLTSLFYGLLLILLAYLYLVFLLPEMWLEFLCTYQICNTFCMPHPSY